ncbi:selenate reductase subunit YgfN [Escherichia coli]|uniref:Selenate reductase subunit YgfN n=1 Tax=Escherichia coli TaxID=562 RepID=A0A376TSJ9_ECOLX|nr:selenate reductase subunit YgfN [Escherichia coli]
MSIDEAMAEDAPVVHDEPVVYVAGVPDTLEDDNSHAAQRGEHMIINFPIGSRPRKNIAASIHGHIGDMDKGFADADVIIERTYNSTQAQQCPTENTYLLYPDGRRSSGYPRLHPGTMALTPPGRAPRGHETA